MQIDYIISNSPGKGKGVFTTQNVTQYSLIWDFNKANINIYNENSAKGLINKLQEKDTEDNTCLKQLLNYAYFSNDNIYVDIRGDDGKFFNHSNNPNVALGKVLLEQNIPGNYHMLSTYAIRDIILGEELCDNYNTYYDEPEWYKNIIEQNGLDFSFMKN